MASVIWLIYFITSGIKKFIVLTAAFMTHIVEHLIRTLEETQMQMDVAIDVSNVVHVLNVERH